MLGSLVCPESHLCKVVGPRAVYGCGGVVDAVSGRVRPPRLQGHLDTVLGVLSQPAGDMVLTYAADERIQLYRGVFDVDPKAKSQEKKAPATPATVVSDSYPCQV